MSFLAGRNRSRKFCKKSVQNLMSLEYCKVASSHKKMETEAPLPYSSGLLDDITGWIVYQHLKCKRFNPSR